MTQTDVMASGRWQTAGAASMSKGLFAGRPRRRALLRRLLALPVALLLALALAAPAFAATTTTKGTSGYNQVAPKPGSGTGPSKSSSTSKSESSAAATSSAPTTSRSTLPFTGFDLRWVVGGGLLLMGAGLSIRVVQRRQRHDIGR